MGIKWNTAWNNITADINNVKKNVNKRESMNNSFSIIQTFIKRELTQHENFKLFDFVYNENDNLLSVKFKIYSCGADCDEDKNVFSEYEITATYTDEKLSTYKMIRK